jgi:hypothetical protein
MTSALVAAIEKMNIVQMDLDVTRLIVLVWDIKQHSCNMARAHNIKIEDTATGIRISVHVYANDRQTALKEVIETYLETKQLADKEKILVAPMEINK